MRNDRPDGTHARQPEIETKRLVLRRPRLRDAPRIAALLNNFEVTKNLARVPHPYTLNMARGLADAAKARLDARTW